LAGFDGTAPDGDWTDWDQTGMGPNVQDQLRWVLLEHDEVEWDREGWDQIGTDWMGRSVPD
jgi:hypothetical protein